MESQPSIIRFSLDGAPERRRLSVLRDHFARHINNLDIALLDDRPRLNFEFRPLPGVTIARAETSPHTIISSHDPSRENADLVLAWARRPCKALMTHRDKELRADDGTAIFTICTEPVRGESLADFDFVTVRLQRSLLSSVLPRPEDFAMRPIPPQNEALRLLDTYVEVLRESGEPQCPKVSHAVGLHIADLVALAVGTTRDASEFAASRGLRAARAASVKASMLERIADPNLSVAAVAGAHGISPRYVQLLFEQEGTSFSSWLRGERLALARRRLADPALAHRQIAVIAYDCGFSDLSWFNRSFRQAYGETPSDVRQRERFETRH